MAQETDFIVSELLSELKEGNARKDQQLRNLIKVLVATIIGALVSLLLVVAGFLWYLNQYDFTSTTTTTETITKTAEGVYAIVDGEGNVISADLTAEEALQILEEVATDGDSNGNQSTYADPNP